MGLGNASINQADLMKKTVYDVDQDGVVDAAEAGEADSIDGGEIT